MASAVNTIAALHHGYLGAERGAGRGGDQDECYVGRGGQGEHRRRGPADQGHQDEVRDQNERDERAFAEHATERGERRAQARREHRGDDEDDGREVE
ncbi:MAG TPA: hypothetical protein VFE42_05550 [Chloroflexota bacterium]|nr:hypothetical protein [Chloroflexota bacterium]